MALEMQRVPFSSHVLEIGYDSDGGVLAVRYAPDVKNPAGRLVEYLGVDHDTADQVINAPSVGSALHQFVRGQFQHRG